MEHKILFANCNRENRPTFLDFPPFLGIFQWDELTKHVPVTAQPEIPEMLTKWKVPITICINWVPYPHSKDWRNTKTQNLFEVFKTCSAVQRI